MRRNDDGGAGSRESKDLLKMLLVLLCLLAYETPAWAQTILQKTFKLDGKNASYYVLQPTDSITGILLLLPAKGENPKSVFKKSGLPEILSAKGYLTVVPNLKYALYTDDPMRKQISEILNIESSHASRSSGLVIGGFSAGGSVALSFAEYLVAQGLAANLKSVFVIDPPLDMQRLYAASRRMRRYACAGSVQAEAQGTIDYLDKAMGGSPDDQYNNYVSFSPFMASEADGGNAKWLKKVALRLYSEPDIDFVRERHCSELEAGDLNAGDLEKLSKLLKKAGNDRCEYIVTKGRGYHTWNIAEPEELAAWIVKPENR